LLDDLLIGVQCLFVAGVEGCTFCNYTLLPPQNTPAVRASIIRETGGFPDCGTDSHRSPAIPHLCAI